MNKVKVNISFDIEDVYGNQNILNSILYMILSFTDKNMIPIDLYISAIKYPLIKTDLKLIKLIKQSKFINIGYHSNTHSFHIIPEQDSIENLRKIEEFKFDYKKNIFLNKKGGVKYFLQQTKAQMFRCPGYCWTPDYFQLMREYKMKLTTIDIDFPKVIKFMGLIIIPTQIRPLEKIKSNKELDELLEGSEYRAIYMHPARLIYNHFWDKMLENTYHVINYREIYDNYFERIKKIQDILIHLKKNYDLFSGYDLISSKFDKIRIEDLMLKNKIKKAMVEKWGWSQITSPVNKNYHINKFDENSNSIELINFNRS